MTAVVWANILLAIPFLVTFIAVPLWWTVKRPQAGPDHTEARAYLRTRDRLRLRVGPPPGCPRPDGRGRLEAMLPSSAAPRANASQQVDRRATWARSSVRAQVTLRTAITPTCA